VRWNEEESETHPQMSQIDADERGGRNDKKQKKNDPQMKMMKMIIKGSLQFK
jgi:hypothetical protein